MIMKLAAKNAGVLGHNKEKENSFRNKVLGRTRKSFGMRRWVVDTSRMGLRPTYFIWSKGSRGSFQQRSDPGAGKGFDGQTTLCTFPRDAQMDSSPILF